MIPFRLSQTLRAGLSILLSVSVVVAPRSIYAQQTTSIPRKAQYRYALGVELHGEGVGRIQKVVPGGAGELAGLHVGDIIRSVNGTGDFKSSNQLMQLIVSKAEENAGTLLILFDRDQKQHFTFANVVMINDSNNSLDVGSYRPHKLNELYRYAFEYEAAGKTSAEIVKRAESIKDKNIQFATLARNFSFFRTTLLSINVSNFPAEFQRRHRALAEIVGKFAEVVEMGPSTRTQPYLTPWGEEIKQRNYDIKKLLAYMNESGISADFARGPQLKGNLNMELRLPAREGWQDTNTRLSNEALIGVGLLLVGGLVVASMASSNDAASASSRGNDNLQSRNRSESPIKTVFNCSRCGWSGDHRPPRCPSCREGVFFWTSQK
jgi:membrane-associated protease RseP (regulator of RpoE activity)